MVVLYFLAAGIALLHDRRVDKRRADEFGEFEIDHDAEDDPEAASRAAARARAKRGTAGEAAVDRDRDRDRGTKAAG